MKYIYTYIYISTHICRIKFYITKINISDQKNYTKRKYFINKIRILRLVFKNLNKDK